MTINQLGNVGIGTTSPYAKLSLAGAAGGTTNLFALSTSTSGFATTTAIQIDQNGNLSLFNGTPPYNAESSPSVLSTASSMAPNGAVGTIATNSLGLLASSSISATGPLSYNVATGVFTIAQSGPSTDGYLSQGDWNSFNNRLSTSSLGLFDKSYFFSTTSATYFSAQGLAFSTSSANYFLSVNQGNSFSTTSAINFVNSSTTIPKTYTANTFSNSNTFNGGLTVSNLNGPLQANNASSRQPRQSASPMAAPASPLLPQTETSCRNAAGGYVLTSTSSLGLLASSSISATGPLSYSVSTGVFSIAQSVLRPTAT